MSNAYCYILMFLSNILFLLDAKKDLKSYPAVLTRNLGKFEEKLHIFFMSKKSYICLV
jgi:hypothetical protein